MSAPACPSMDSRAKRVLFVHSAVDDAKLSPSQFRVLSHIFRRADGESGRATAGIDSMAAVCRMKADTVRAALAALVERRMVVREDRAGFTSSYIPTSSDQWLPPQPDNVIHLPASQTRAPLPKRDPSPKTTPPEKGGGPPTQTGDGSPPETGGGYPSPQWGDEGNPNEGNPKEGNPKKEILSTPSLPLFSTVLAADAAAVGEGEGKQSLIVLAARGKGKIARRPRRDRSEAEVAAILSAAVTIGEIMHRRRPPSEWSDAEKKAFVDLCDGAGVPTAEELAVVRARYDAEWPPREGNTLRRDMKTLVGNWPAEVDRAYNFAAARNAPPPGTAPKPLPTAEDHDRPENRAL